MRKGLMRTLVGTGLAALGLAAGVVTAPAASAEELPGCAIWADAPFQGGVGIIGTAHREGCAQKRTITVRIRKDISFWPDETVAERTWTNVVNGNFSVGWNCSHGDGGVLFTEILTSAGGKAQSIRRGLPCPN
jgi:hypothetical protein